MKLPIVFCSLILFLSCQRHDRPVTKFVEPVAALYDAALKPFYHGVASGDPLPNRVIIWTRVTPDDSVASVAVKWEVSLTPDFSNVIQHHIDSALASRDYTLKVDVDSLKPNQVYYYRFHALGRTSIVGRTKTAPEGNTDSLKFAVVTCANWEWGYFNSYARLGEREALDAVIHLGDYIYEHATGVYGDTTIGRHHIPPHELLSLSDYRTRYSQYRLDPGLRKAHQQQAFIAIWDDHEIANDSYSEGAKNHQPEEGDYQIRKASARQAYYEWLPIRESAQLYRHFSFGNLADLVMLDERLAGRTKPVESIEDPTYNDKGRSMLGPTQLQWLENQLTASSAAWKIIGNQVLFSDVDQQAIRPGSPRNLDSWSGYPFEQSVVQDFIVRNKLRDIIFITGDTHASWAIEASTRSIQPPFAVELCTTSISSSNGDETLSVEKVKQAESNLLAANPNVKFFNDRDHGYLLLSLNPARIRAQWFYVETVRKPDNRQHLGKEFIIKRGSAELN